MPFRRVASLLHAALSLASCSKQAKGGPSKTMKHNLGLYSTPEALQQYNRYAAASANMFADLLAAF